MNEEVNWVQRAEALAVNQCHFIEGRDFEGSGNRYLDKFSPRDGRRLSRFASASPDDVQKAISSAQRAFEDGRWSKRSVQNRKDVLAKLAVLIEDHREELALYESLDVGKPITAALNFDVPSSASVLRFCVEAADKLHGNVYGANPSGLSYELRRPVGVVAGIIGWNFPLFLAMQKIGPALAAGNSLVLKPSELTCLSARRVAELAVEAGVPEGVLNVINGDAETGIALSRDPNVPMLSFTGSTQTGKRLLIASGESNMKRLLLECGGKAPNIVFGDGPPVECIADAILASAFWNQGQVCVASSRLLVEASVHEELLRCLIEKASALKIGDPLDSHTQSGAVVSESHRQKVLAYIESGEREGARLVYHPSLISPFPNGFYMSPAIFDRVNPRQRIAQEEIFGPVLCVIPFCDENDAIRIANDTIYGLSATVWTRDVGRAHRLSYAIDAGWTVVNATSRQSGGSDENVITVGGHKQSGIGAEGGIRGLEMYTRSTAVQIFV